MATRLETEENVSAVAEEPQMELNQATTEELATLPGIGPVLARRIVSYRDEHGPFLFVGDIRQVPGIGSSLYEDLEDRLTATVPQSSEVAEEEAPEEPDNGTAPEFDIAEVERGPLESLREAETDLDPGLYAPPPLEPPVEASAAEEEDVTEDEEAPLPSEGGVEPVEEQQGLADESEEATAGDDETSGVFVPTVPMEGPETQPRQAASSERSRYGWVWTALLGAVLGAVLGMVLTLLVFAGINGSIDVGRSQGMTQMRGQVNELTVELDAIQGDISTLQGDVSGLRARVEVLSGLTARMEQAEDALETFTLEIQALQDETTALTTSLGTLADDVEVMGETLDAVEAETERATSFFEGLQDLMQEIFGESTSPQSAAPATLEEAAV